MTAYYNEIDPQAAAWLRELIKQGHIAPGIVDERDIRDVRPEDLREFTQCHFFAGIGVWSYALRRAGWPDDRPAWTGSCPCQPFSAAGRRGGVADERHLWPHWHHLIEQCGPSVVFGEQVASKGGLGWLDLVQADLEGAGYASGAVDLCAAGVGAPHIRQRLWFVAERVADANSGQRQGLTNGEGCQPDREATGRQQGDGKPPSSGELCGMADTERDGLDRAGQERQTGRGEPTDGSGGSADRHPGPTNGLWRDSDWILCRDGRWRPVEPGTFPLAHGAPARVGRLRGYGNAINAEAAAQVIGAYMEAR